jgi:5-(carboxyamino)imidazole ribonucleotide synthase
MGHINVVASSHKNLGEKLLQLTDYLPIEHYPLLEAEAIRLQKN